MNIRVGLVEICAILLSATAAADAAPVHHQSGLVAELQLGANSRFGDSGSGVGLGFRVAGTLGYELQLGRFGLLPQLLVFYDRWGAGEEGLSLSWLGVMGGVKASIYAGRVAPWIALHGGYGRAGVDFQRSVSENGYGLNFGLGLDIVLSRNIAIGGALLVTKMIADNQLGAQDLSFAISVKMKL